MRFEKIEMQTWPRAATYQHYMRDVPCTYSMCVSWDITAIKAQTDALGLKLFPVLLYGLSTVVNQHKEFRMGLDHEKQPGYYDIVHPSYTVFHPQSESFTVTWSAFDNNFAGFYQRYLQDAQRALQHQEGFESAAQPVSQLPITPPNLFDVSCIPWASFTSFHLNIKPGYEHLLPIFTLGQFTQQAGNIQLPLAIQVHHAACDGFHVARFVKELQTWTEDFSVE